MKWTTILVAVVLASTTLITAAGCDTAGDVQNPSQQPATTTQQPASTTQQPASTNQQPASANQGMQPPPSDNFTQGGRPPAPAMDLAAAAAKLGITEQQLKDAMGTTGQKPPDMASIASKLGVTEAALLEALGIPEGGPGGNPPHNGAPPQGSTPPAGQGPTGPAK